jgi:hypothetical protein
MIVEVLVTQRQCVDSLGDQVPSLVLDKVGIAMVSEAGCELSNDAGELFCLTQQKCAAV